MMYCILHSGTPVELSPCTKNGLRFTVPEASAGGTPAVAGGAVDNVAGGADALPGAAAAPEGAEAAGAGSAAAAPGLAPAVAFAMPVPTGGVAPGRVCAARAFAAACAFACARDSKSAIEALLPANLALKSFRVAWNASSP